mmetsp:Transcript_16077/g.32169  ORF Transcript_16077/g.32169 Transcript_16077/m.32169 type:complete len:168 (+) Transcript_16077:228-731(+)
MPLFGSSLKAEEKRANKEALLTALVDVTSSTHHTTIDDATILRIAEAIRADSSLLEKMIKFLKAKIKDEDPMIQCVGLEVLDKCMSSEIGFPCQYEAKHKILPRVVKLTDPKEGYHHEVQRRAKVMIWRWADLYGKDVRLGGFMTAYGEVKSKGGYEEAEETAESTD